MIKMLMGTSAGNYPTVNLDSAAAQDSFGPYERNCLFQDDTIDVVSLRYVGDHCSHESRKSQSSSICQISVLHQSIRVKNTCPM